MAKKLDTQEHPNKKAIRQTVLGYTDGEDAKKICRHLILCPECRKYQIALFLGSPNIYEEEEGVSHPSKKLIRQYREGHLSDEAVWQKVHEHLYLCRTCDEIYEGMFE